MTMSTMAIMMPLRLFLVLLTAFSNTIASPVLSNNNKNVLRIFILGGQSNQEGRGSIRHLKSLVETNLTHSEYTRFWSSHNNNWTELSDVYIRYEGYNDVFQGPLKAGYGGPPFGSAIGPELAFGFDMGDDPYPGETLLLKCAWGGRSMAVDFRPPSRGMGNYTDETGRPLPPSQYGFYYRRLVNCIQSSLANLTAIKPSYRDMDYKVEGLVWFQGFADTKKNETIQEYPANMKAFIRDLRLDIGLPHLPFVLGETGMSGITPDPSVRNMHMRFRRAQRSVTQSVEYRDTSTFVQTASYVIDGMDSYDGFNYIHYYGRADAYYHIGRAFAKAMLDLLEDIKERGSETMSLSSQR